MPVMGGVELASRARALAPYVPIVFVSGFTAEDRGLPLDARTVFVPKPYTIASLCSAIGAVVAVRGGALTSDASRAEVAEGR
jgi:CheY-like chemotaxis protein